MARQFGHTWWGAAWVEALESRAGLDPNRLPRGRTYARQGHVSRLEIESGRITALVRGSRVLPYRVTVGVRTFDDTQWSRTVTVLADRSARAAALLEGELDPEIAEALRSEGLELLPGPGDLEPRCSCPDHAAPCKHSAAVCYLVADALDHDPFALFALRGRSRDSLLAAVGAARHRRPGSDTNFSSEPEDQPRGDSGALVDPGVTARTAWQAWTDRTGERGSPALPDPPEQPGTPAPWPEDPPADAPFTAEGLKLLAADAARRAWGQLVDGVPSGLLLSADADLARRAASRLDRGEPIVDLARASGQTTKGLSAQAALWRHAGADGLDHRDASRWRPAGAVVDAGVRAFIEAGVDRTAIQVRSNRVTVDDVQLRVTSDGRWWRYERRDNTWELVEAPSPDPTDLVG